MIENKVTCLHISLPSSVYSLETNKKWSVHVRQKRKKHEYGTRCIINCTDFFNMHDCVLYISCFHFIHQSQITFVKRAMRKEWYLSAFQSDWLLSLSLMRKKIESCIIDHCSKREIKTCVFAYFFAFCLV